MVLTLHAVLIVVALASFLFATANVPVRVNLVALGLFCWLLAATFVT